MSTSVLQKQIDEALSALRQEDFKRAHELAMSALQANPQLPGGYFVMARIAHWHGNVAKAEEIIRRALHFAADNPDYLLFQAQCLLELSRDKQVKEITAGLVHRELSTAHQNDTLGVIHTRLGQHQLALDRFKTACAKAPDSIEYLFNLGSCQQFCGELAGARLSFETITGIEPKHFASHLALAQLHKHTASDNDLEQLQALWSELDKADADGHLYVGHALARVYEDLGDYARAIDSLRAAKQPKLAQIRDNGLDYGEIFKALEELPPATGEGDGFDSDEPVFIVGMPRTGTTLVERILSSHSAVDSAGELGNLSTLVKQQLGTASPWVLDKETLAQLGRLDYRRLGQEYLASTRHLTGSSARFIDKMPFNFMYIPVIARALPNARIVCLRRNPMDTCLSNFRQLFGLRFSYYNYAYSLQHTAQFYAQFHRLMEHYERALPGQFYQVQYESLVQNPEQEARSLLNYCQLDWEPACLDFQRNTAPVATASSVQVREGIYHRAVERWRHYEPWLDEVKAELERAGIPWD
jgi:tetratricopeptide (TPR) repeat protein